ncbi:cytoskeletal protein RodZ [Streptomyces sp. B4I13]|uniref:hypothetical protein n=1 Tax=Streptomyces sp. B4I13 TaxID=3042271 RepID=UPI0027838366|nr:hypothetical protein [Streptomyces sp. B4I13]MDQ0959895.1 cytoskeletal protein RodZ [Streptomyces sp. B4I13]
MKFVKNRYAPVAALFVCCCLPLAACGTERPGTQTAGTQAAGDRSGGGSSGSSAGDETSDDGEETLPDTTSDDQGTGPDTTTDDQGTLPDTTTDDQGTLPDTTSDDQGTGLDTTTDDQGTGPDTTSDDQGDAPPVGDTTDDAGSVPTEGPHRWFPMLREFRAYLASSVPEADAAVSAHVTSVQVRVPAGSARSVAVVHVDYGLWEQAGADRTARIFARWRLSVYGDHGHVRVLGPAKTTAEANW